mmetsp:Transcript_6404/g.10867  ORF Transcript_6404/g.10867 Transcript_6404/m.10867 type:complete len:123 (-) Transcript_6404:233-601(-)
MYAYLNKVHAGDVRVSWRAFASPQSLKASLMAVAAITAAGVRRLLKKVMAGPVKSWSTALLMLAHLARGTAGGEWTRHGRKELCEWKASGEEGPKAAGGLWVKRNVVSLRIDKDVFFKAACS